MYHPTAISKRPTRGHRSPLVGVDGRGVGGISCLLLLVIRYGPYGFQDGILLHGKMTRSRRGSLFGSRFPIFPKRTPGPGQSPIPVEETQGIGANPEG